MYFHKWSWLTVADRSNLSPTWSFIHGIGVSFQVTIWPSLIQQKAWFLFVIYHKNKIKGQKGEGFEDFAERCSVNHQDVNISVTCRWRSRRWTTRTRLASVSTTSWCWARSASHCLSSWRTRWRSCTASLPVVWSSAPSSRRWSSLFPR